MYYGGEHKSCTMGRGGRRGAQERGEAEVLCPEPTKGGRGVCMLACKLGGAAPRGRGIFSLFFLQLLSTPAKPDIAELLFLACLHACMLACNRHSHEGHSPEEGVRNFSFFFAQLFSTTAKPNIAQLLFAICIHNIYLIRL